MSQDDNGKEIPSDSGHTGHPPDAIIAKDIENILFECNKEMACLSGRTLLLTGGSGFVGSYLVESVMAFNRVNPDDPCELYLPTRNPEQVALNRPNMVNVEHMNWFHWDGRSPLKIGSDDCDYVIHAASPSDPARYMNDPEGTRSQIEDMTRYIIDFSKGRDIRSFLYISSGARYGQQPPDLFAIPEGYDGMPDPSKPASCYGLGKAASEALCQNSGLPLVIGRLFSFIGPYQDITSSFAVPDFIRQGSKDGHIIIEGDGTPIRGYCYASDLTIILWKLLLMKNRKYDIYNVGSSEFIISIKGLAQLISETIGDITVEVLGKGTGPKGSPSRYVPDIARLKDIHVPGINIGMALEMTLRSMRARNILSR